MVKGTLVAKKVVKREPGFLYFIDKAGNVRKTPMKSRKTKK